MIREVDGNWTEMIMNGSLLEDNVFSGFKSKILTTIQMDFYGLIGDPAAQSKFLNNLTDGTFGLAPYTADIHPKQFNTLYQLKSAKKIDSMIFSIWMQMNNVSYVKIGGYDEEGA